ncbi:MAG: TlpA family protein disulfide reductase [Deltaproteobacteria bacterium]|nr:MAG: TlpA family protein disulfide reductase [Deltaproteobacteria bacterium]
MLADSKRAFMNRRLPAGVWLWGGLFLVLAAAVAAPWLLPRKIELPPASESYYKALRIERPDKTVVAPDFTLEDLSRKSVSLRNVRGKVVFLNFWATWCVPCREEMPAMERLHRELKGEGLEVIAVNYRETEKEIAPFLKELGLTFTALLDPDGRVSEEYGVWSLPLSYFVNRKGEFVGKAVGSRDWTSQETKIFFRQLLAKKSS